MKAIQLQYPKGVKRKAEKSERQKAQQRIIFVGDIKAGTMLFCSEHDSLIIARAAAKELKKKRKVKK